MRSNRLAVPALSVAMAIGSLGLWTGGALGQAGTPDFTDPSAPKPTTPARPEPGTERPDAPSRPGAPGGLVDLRPKFKKGQQLRYVLEQDALSRLKTQGGAEAGGLDGDQKLNQRLTLVMRVVEGTDEGATIQVSYEAIAVKMTTPGGSGEYDSAKGKSPAPQPAPQTTPRPTTPTKPNTPPKPTKPGKPTEPADPDDPLKDYPKMPTTLPGLPGATPGGAGGDLDEALEQMIAPMVGQTITVKTDHNGQVISVSGGEGLGGGGMGGMGASLVPPPSAIANWLVAGAAGTKGHARVGESWTNNDSLAGTPVGSFRMVTQHTLQSAHGGIANAKFTGHIEKASEGSPMGLAQVKDSRYSGTYGWDTRSGSLKEMSADMHVMMDANLGGTPAEMTSQSRVRVTRQDAPGGWPRRD